MRSIKLQSCYACNIIKTFFLCVDTKSNGTELTGYSYGTNKPHFQPLAHFISNIYFILDHGSKYMLEP